MISAPGSHHFYVRASFNEVLESKFKRKFLCGYKAMTAPCGSALRTVFKRRVLRKTGDHSMLIGFAPLSARVHKLDLPRRAPARHCRQPPRPCSATLQPD